MIEIVIFLWQGTYKRLSLIICSISFFEKILRLLVKLTLWDDLGAGVQGLLQQNAIMKFDHESCDDAAGNWRNKVEPDVVAESHLREYVRIDVGNLCIIVLVPDEKLQGKSWILESTINARGKELIPANFTWIGCKSLLSWHSTNCGGAEVGEGHECWLDEVDKAATDLTLLDLKVSENEPSHDEDHGADELN